MSKLTDDQIKETVECYILNNCQVRPTAKKLGLSRSTVRDRLGTARKHGLIQQREKSEDSFSVDDKYKLQSIIVDLKKELNLARKHKLSANEIRSFVYEIKQQKPEIPDWLIDFNKCKSTTTGVPSLLISDAHWGEVVNSSQVNGVNEYNLEIANKRLIALCERTIDILKNHIANPNYPGIVINLAGDFYSGNIHEELKVTNEVTLLQAVFDLYCKGISFIKTFADNFGKVFLPCVAGNHGRTTFKVQAKNFSYENVDWHVYSLWQKYFENDNRIKFLVSDSEDLTYKIYGWKYRLTHGGQFRGGDGIIGALGPLCVAPETPVLKADLNYIHAGDLKLNDELVGFDENVVDGKRRLFKPSVVTEIKQLELDCIEIETEDGLKTISSTDHPWLTRSGSSHSWSLTKNLHLGSRILSLGVPWKRENSWEAGYLSGILDGEGTCGDSKIQFTQQNNACFKSSCEILDNFGISYNVYPKNVSIDGYEECYDIRLFEGNVDRKLLYETLSLLGKIRPERLIEEKSYKIWIGKSVQIAKDVKVVGLKYIGKKILSGFTTSTSTFIANGMLTHNTRGDAKKRAQSADMGDSYDTLLCGHFHRLITLRSIISNGSIVGFNEYAKRENMRYEPPQQALWITHPRRGITFNLPVHLDEYSNIREDNKNWISWPDK